MNRKLTIIKDLVIKTIPSGYRRRFVRVRCFCGVVFECQQAAIRSINTKSCGRLNHIKKTIRQVNHPAYSVWQSMKKRCYNSNSQYYYLYGGRGIKVCEDWNKSLNFLKWCDNNGYKKYLFFTNLHKAIKKVKK